MREKAKIRSCIKIKLKNNKCKPEYMTPLSSGMDLRACIEEPLLIRPLERLLIPTGVTVDIPKGYEGQVRPRSGLAIKNGLTLLNSPGTVDADYRGEIKVILVNISNNEYLVQPYERIAQLVIMRVEKLDLKFVKGLSSTKRGSGGFGHTGIK